MNFTIYIYQVGSVHGIARVGKLCCKIIEWCNTMHVNKFFVILVSDLY